MIIWGYWILYLCEKSLDLRPKAGAGAPFDYYETAPFQLSARNGICTQSLNL